MDRLGLAGRRVIVTGAASGIGRATAERLTADGAVVAWLDRDAAGLERAAPSGAVRLVADQTDGSAVERAIAEAAAGMGGIDGIVNAAGIADNAPTRTVGLDRWNQVLAVNLTGPFLICQAAYEHLMRGNDAAIVNVASGSGVLPSGAGSAYAASKAGLIMLTKNIAFEWGPKIRANAICPGTVDTPMLDGLFEKDEAFMERLRRSYALQRMAKPEELAEAAAFLVSTRASFVTGITMAVDGGRTFH